MQYVAEKRCDPITLLVYPGEASEGLLYEDDGESYDYLEGAYALTRYRCERRPDGTITLSIGSPEGAYREARRPKGYEIRIWSDRAPKSVLVGGARIEREAGAQASSSAGESRPAWQRATRGGMADRSRASRRFEEPHFAWVTLRRVAAEVEMLLEF